MYLSSFLNYKTRKKKYIRILLRMLYKFVQAELPSQYITDVHIICQTIQERDELEQFFVVVVIEPTFDGDPIFV